MLFTNSLDIVFDGEGKSYKVLNLLGQGGFGQVFQIQKEDDGSLWALKTLPPYASNEDDLRGFRNESEMALKVSHENTMHYVYVHDGSVHTNLPPYIIMELANEGSLSDLIEQHKNSGELLTVEVLHQMFIQLVDGMEHINNYLVHRDIKPDNILIKDGNLIITDFGLAKIVDATTRNQQLTFKGYGTFDYIAPEGWKFDHNTIQMDIYAMGMTFYELATLQKAFNVSDKITSEEWSKKHLYEMPIPPHKKNPSLTPTISQVIMKMIEKSTKKRYSSWEEIRKDLTKDSYPKTNNEERIATMLQQHMEKTAIQRSKELEAEKAVKEKAEYVEIIFSQFKNDIYTPIEEFIGEFNRQCLNGQIALSNLRRMQKSSSTTLKLLSNNTLTIELQVLNDEDFIRNVPTIFGSGFKKELLRPTLRDKKVLAWGYIKNQQDVGYNILLLENEGELYGEWVLLLNRPSGFGNEKHNRPQQFIFSLSELEKEIQYIGALHVYQTEILPYDDSIIQVFIMNNN